jgi:hypothetical protein
MLLVAVLMLPMAGQRRQHTIDYLAAGMCGAIMYLPLFVQGVIGNSATNSGEELTPMMAGFMLSSIIGGQILSHTGRYKVLALVSFAVAAAGMFLLSHMDASARGARGLSFDQ